jgi:L-asparaginase II
MMAPISRIHSVDQSAPGPDPNYSRDRVTSFRSGIIENTHAIHAAVVDANGNLLLSVGNPGRLTLARSAIKPAQTLAILETPGVEQYGFDRKDIALMCASHNSEDRHIIQARRMLQATGIDESDLQCGGHPASNPTVNRRWIKSDFSPSAVYNNCSGKHIGMLTASRALDADHKTYHHLDHPMQMRVQKVVENLTDLEPQDIQWGIDGCNLPAPALPLEALARVFANLAAASSDVADVPCVADALHSGASLLPNERADLLALIFDCMAQNPEMIAGEGRFCTELMQAFQGCIVGKVGADGCYGVSIRPREFVSHRLGPIPIGIAVKVEDGDLSVLYAAVMEILEQLEVGSSKVRQQLAKWHYPQLKNTAGVVVGTYSFSMKLQTPGASGPNGRGHSGHWISS